MYYLNSRYYNHEIGRFINADGLIGQTGEILGHNMYAYTQNNPVMYVDPNGEHPILIIIVVASVLILNGCAKKDDKINQTPDDMIGNKLGKPTNYKEYELNDKYDPLTDELNAYAYLDSLAYHNAKITGPIAFKRAEEFKNFEKIMNVIDFASGVSSDGLTPDDFSIFAPGTDMSSLIATFPSYYHDNMMKSSMMFGVYDLTYSKESGHFYNYYTARYVYWRGYFSN